jgi:hypothetical protein
MTMGRLALVVATALAAAVLASSASAAWHQLVGGASPVNQASDQNAFGASLAAIGGVPYVAWHENDGTNTEIRVSRLNAAGTAWEQVVGGPSPINHDNNRSAREPSLTAIGGVPYVAWHEDDGTNTEIRVSRLNAAGTAWEGVVGGPSPINHDSNRSAFAPSLTAIGGVPYVAWDEDDGTNSEIRVSRLNAAGTAWEEVVGGASPINHDSNRSAFDVSLTAIGGVPYVAWSETDGVNDEVRVSRLNAAGTAWEEVVGGASPINHSSAGNAGGASLAAIGGVPYVAWSEYDGVNDEVRVSRLNAAGTAWEQVVGGPSPINHAASRDAFVPTLAAIGGVPYLAWSEDDGVNTELRVSRLEPEFSSQSAVASATGATLTAGVHTYGIPYPIGFQYGPALAAETATDPAPAGSDQVTVTTQVGGLTPSTGYPFRPFATAGVPAPRVLGTIDAFTTLATARSGGAGPRRAFGKKTLVTLRLAAGRIPAKGPLAVRVANANRFQIIGKLSGRTKTMPSVSRRRRIELRAKSFRIAARAHKTVKLSLPEAARRLLQRERKLSVRLTATVKDPAGHTRTISKTVEPKLTRQRMAKAPRPGRRGRSPAPPQRAAARRAVLPFEASPRWSPSRADNRAKAREPRGFRADLAAGRRLREEGQQR